MGIGKGQCNDSYNNKWPLEPWLLFLLLFLLLLLFNIDTFAARAYRKGVRTQFWDFPNSQLYMS